MEKICIGKVVKLHGYMGQMKVRAKFDNDFDIKKITNIYDEADNEFKVNKIFKVNDGVVVALEGVDLEKSRGMVGNDFYIARTLVEDKILIEDLKGSKVLLEDGTNIGTIVDVADYGAAEVFSVKNDNGKEIMFPNVKGLIINFNYKEKELVISKERYNEVADEN